jgi:hypothetical protein
VQHFKSILALAHDGLLNFAVDTREQGIAYAETEFVIFVDRMRLVENVENSSFVGDPDDLVCDALERRAIARADKIIFPNRAQSSSATKWLFPIGERSRIAAPRYDWIVDRKRGGRQPTHPIDAAQPGIQVLFIIDGTCARNGLDAILAALDQLSASGEPWVSGLSVVFLGSDYARSADFQTILIEKLKSWVFQGHVLLDQSIDESLSMLAGGAERGLAIVPAEAEGWLLDAAAHCAGLPRLLVRPVEFENDATWPGSVARDSTALANRLLAWGSGEAIVPPQERRRSQRVSWLGGPLANGPLPHSEAAAKEGRPRPFVSVCVSHFNQLDALWIALRSIEANDYPAKEMIVVDDGSSRRGVDGELEEIDRWLRDRGGILVRQDHRHLGAARNAASRRAGGDLLIFLDGGSIAEPNMIDAFVEGWRRTGADALTSSFFVFDDSPPVQPGQSWPLEMVVPLGPDPTIGALFNCFGDANMMISRPAFEASGGFGEDFGGGHESWELLCRLMLAGYKIERLTVPLFWRRLSLESRLRTRAGAAIEPPRNLRAYREARPDMFRLALLSQGALSGWARLATGIDGESQPEGRPMR